MSGTEEDERRGGPTVRGPGRGNQRQAAAGLGLGATAEEGWCSISRGRASWTCNGVCLNFCANSCVSVQFAVGQRGALRAASRMRRGQPRIELSSALLDGLWIRRLSSERLYLVAQPAPRVCKLAHNYGYTNPFFAPRLIARCRHTEGRLLEQ